MDIQIFTAAEMASKFEDLVVAEGESQDVDTTAREADLHKLNKDGLVALIISLEAKGKRAGTTVQDIARAMLTDEDCLAVNYETIAEACRLLIPGAKTSSKSIASYVSKKREEWDLPIRYMVRTPKARVIEAPKASDIGAPTDSVIEAPTATEE